MTYLSLQQLITAVAHLRSDQGPECFDRMLCLEFGPALAASINRDIILYSAEGDFVQVGVGAMDTIWTILVLRPQPLTKRDIKEPLSCRTSDLVKLGKTGDQIEGIRIQLSGRAEREGVFGTPDGAMLRLGLFGLDGIAFIQVTFAESVM